jgi:AcrR family transcriptional regulator
MMALMASEQPYHHGDLPEALLAATAEAIDELGVAALSLRDVARRAGVSHAAPAHHFGDKQGLLTAFAAQGFEWFADALETVAGEAAGVSSVERFNALGRAYVGFSVSHKAHFEVMWRPDLCDHYDVVVSEPAGRAFRALQHGVEAMQDEGVATGSPTEDVMIAAWSLVHGLSWLVLQQRLEIFGEVDPEDLAERINRVLFPG